MKTLCLALPLLSALLTGARIQTENPAPNPALIPVPRTDAGILRRQAECLRRAKETPSADVVFLGDSITQAWDDTGKELWKQHFAPLGAVNLGVSGDRTEHVLWRLQEAPLTRLQPKVVVLLIGTNNLGHGTSTGEQTLEGVLKVIQTLRAQAPQAKLLVHEIFPRGERFNPMRGEIAQVNQVLRTQPSIRVLGIGDRWVRADGSISAAIMPDFLHLSPEGYSQWALALKPEIEAALK